MRCRYNVGARIFGCDLDDRIHDNHAAIFRIHDCCLSMVLSFHIAPGGDTSSQMTKVLAPDAIEVAALAPGAPLDVEVPPHLNGMAIALKGGQMGDGHYFEKASVTV